MSETRDGYWCAVVRSENRVKVYKFNVLIVEFEASSDDDAREQFWRVVACHRKYAIN